MSKVREWLEAIGLVQYADAFEANDIDIDLLGQVDDQMLKDIGVSSAGHRLRIRNAIAKLSPASPLAKNENATSTATEPKTQDLAERRQVTVMFSDLVGSTALSARMDPEDLREVISAYQNCVAGTVKRFGGFVAKYMGDGVLVYFGYPQAHEDDAERAVRAGLEMIEAVVGLKTRAPLQTRIGIATGLVVVGDLIGSGSAQEQAVVGETPNFAARLQALAEPNSVVIAESTRKLLGNLFELQDLGAKDLKGVAEPVRAWAALRASSVESRFEALRTATTPLIGRDEEIELLMRRWAQAKAGEGCVVLISGEPGIGKSRIAEALHERISTEPHTRIRFFCSPHHQDSALYPAIAQLERAAGFRREDAAEVRLAKLEALLAQATNDVSGVAPLFADLLSIPTGERYPALALTPQKRKEKTLQALAAQAESLALRQPVLMIFEDVHWSDPTTRELLDLLVDRAPRMRLLALITYRPEFSPAWVGLPHVSLVTLSRLLRRQRAELISQMTGGKTLPREITDQIVERTDGVPLFIEELTKSVIESGVVADAGSRFTLTGAAQSLAIPTSLQASLLARLDRLAPTREVAQIGATIGRSFSHELISAVAQMPLQRLDDALEQLVHAELIFRRGSPPDAEYTFKHALVQDAAYSTLLRSRRQQLHGRVAATIVLTYLGYFDQARSHAEEALLEARRLRHAHTLVYCLWFKCWVISFAATGDAHHAVRTYTDEIYDLSNEHGFPLWSAYATFLRGLNSAAVGQARQGLALMVQALDRTRAMGATITSSRFLAGIAEALFMLGDRGESLSKLHEATEFIQKTDECYFQAEIHRLQGDVLSATGDKAAAESSYQQALAAAVRQKAKAFELRAAMALRDSGAIRPSGMRPAVSSLRSTAGSPKASTRST
jgi:class 3 adenylate cyclase/tetratricopeptide (TPR) repeat protein